METAAARFRSALAGATAGALRRYILGLGPLFPVPQHPVFIGPEGLPGCVIAGLLTEQPVGASDLGVYAAEDAFINCRCIGSGGRLSAASPLVWVAIFPQALGIGFDTIEQFLQSDAPSASSQASCWSNRPSGSIALGSGTSGGVLAPADDGRRSRRSGRHFPARMQAQASGLWSAWARFSAAQCALRSRASSSPSN